MSVAEDIVAAGLTVTVTAAAEAEADTVATTIVTAAVNAAEMIAVNAHAVSAGKTAQQNHATS